jgi:methyltransferase (TIGR00027 family)
MEQDHASLTARRVAISRAEHQFVDNPKILDDPLALRIIGARSASDIRSGRRRLETRFSRYLRAFVVARSRIAEDELADAVKRGVRQYVILGAGLDTFAYRNPHSASMLRVFEVDHPGTQAWKRKQLHEAAITIPESLTFVPVDFETQELADRLREVGFKTDEPSFFSWLGVTMYLTGETVLTTMKYVAALPRGSGIVFDYIVSPSSLSFVHRLALRALAQRVTVVREPWQTFFDPDSLISDLRTIGLTRIEDVVPEEINSRFFSNRTDGLKAARLGRLLAAQT